MVTVKIVLSSEYLTSPVFSYEVEDLRENDLLAQLGLIKPQPAMGPINIFKMEISEALKMKILAWDNTFQETFNQNDPKASGFPNKPAEDAHNKVGEKIADQLRSELPEHYSVEFIV